MADEKPLELRDRIAIEILNGILSSEKGSDRVADIIHYINRKDKYWSKAASDRVENLVRACYKVADIIRKVRLSTFE